MHEPPGGFGVEHVEVAELLAAVLRHRVPPARRPGLAVAGTLLVRVLAVSQRLRQLEREVDRGRQTGGAVRLGIDGRGLVEPGHDGGVVGRGVGERRAGQPTAGGLAEDTVGPQLVEDDRRSRSGRR